MTTLEIIVLTISYGLMIACVAYFKYTDGYKDGQVDALNNKIKYEKKLNSDNETVWTKIE